MANRQAGTVVAIHLAARGGDPLRPVEQVRALPGQGLEGDRYFNRTGTFVKPDGKVSSSVEATLIEAEALAALEQECGIALAPAESRRNILTAGIALNDLVGREFMVGVVHMKGIKLCQPCAYLESKTRQGVKDGLWNRGGLRAQILSEGVLRVGDAVKAVDAAESARGAEAVPCV
jgi:MOSC domain-containing protein YiiM